MTGLIVHPLRLRCLDRMKVLRVPFREQPPDASWFVGIDKRQEFAIFQVRATQYPVRLPYAPGEYFVKEAWGIEPGRYVQPLAEYPIGGRFDDEVFYRIDDPNLPGIAWRSPMHMLEKYARYILTLGPPVPCRLGEVTEEMAIAEGTTYLKCNHSPGPYGCTDCMNTGYLEPPTLDLMLMWNQMYPKHTDPGTWTWGYPMEWRLK